MTHKELRIKTCKILKINLSKHLKEVEFQQEEFGGSGILLRFIMRSNPHVPELECR